MVTVGVIDDDDVIVQGVAALLSAHPDLVRVVDCSTKGGPDERVDVALLDCFALPDHGAEPIGARRATGRRAGSCPTSPGCATPPR